MPPNQQQPGLFQKPQDVFNCVWYFANAMAASLTPLTRSHMGTHAFKYSGIPALVYIFCCAGFTDSMELMWYIPVWLVMVVYRRATADHNEHSEYPGRPWFLGFMSEWSARASEPCLLFFGSMFLAEISPQVTGFIMLGSMAMFVVNFMQQTINEDIQRRQRDAEIEMRRMAEWRNSNGR
jgi:hypothetical protein